MEIPKINFALICDEAFVSEGTKKLNIIGVFQNIFTSQVPALHPKLKAVVVFDLSGEVQKFDLNAKILKKDEKEVIAEIKGEALMKGEGQHQVILDFPLLQFKSYGDYCCEFYLDEKLIIKIPFGVLQSK